MKLWKKRNIRNQKCQRSSGKIRVPETTVSEAISILLKYHGMRTLEFVIPETDIRFRISGIGDGEQDVIQVLLDKTN